MEEVEKQNTAFDDTEKNVTQHEAHPHALRRIVIGIGAVALLVLGGIVWARWGEDIKEACTGEGEICNVELPNTSQEFTTDFEERN